MQWRWSGKAVHGRKLTIFKYTQSQPTFSDPITNSQGSMREEEKKKKGTKQKLERQRTERKLTATYTYWDIINFDKSVNKFHLRHCVEKDTSINKALFSHHSIVLNGCFTSIKTERT